MGSCDTSGHARAIGSPLRENWDVLFSLVLLASTFEHVSLVQPPEVVEVIGPWVPWMWRWEALMFMYGGGLVGSVSVFIDHFMVVWYKCIGAIDL